MRILIVKKRTVPLKIKVCESLLRRLPFTQSHQQQLHEELERRWAGYWGEQSLDYYFNLLDDKKYLILHDLNLVRDEYTFQIDTLLLSPNFLLIIETKNISGKLFFDQISHQLIRTNSSGSEESFPDPITQVRLHKHQLETFFSKHRLPIGPIEYVVVNTNKSSILETNPGYEYIFKKVFKSSFLFYGIQELEKVYQNPIFSSKDLRKISKVLIQSNTPPRKFYLDKYLTTKNSLRTGIHCPSCTFIPMIRMKQQWYCPNCKTYSKDAHIESLYDYFLLIDDKITNQQFRKFAHIESKDVAFRLLSSTNFPSSGKNKGRVYWAPREL